MQPWKIRQEGKMLKALKNFKGNAPVMAKLTKLIGCMKVCKNPSTLGERKHGVHGGCYGAHLTKSVSLIYSIDYASHTVWILDIGDHKRLYGRDDRS